MFIHKASSATNATPSRVKIFSNTQENTANKTQEITKIIKKVYIYLEILSVTSKEDLADQDTEYENLMILLQQFIIALAELKAKNSIENKSSETTSFYANKLNEIYHLLLNVLDKIILSDYLPQLKNLKLIFPYLKNDIEEIFIILRESLFRQRLLAIKLKELISIDNSDFLADNQKNEQDIKAIKNTLLTQTQRLSKAIHNINLTSTDNDSYITKLIELAEAKIVTNCYQDAGIILNILSNEEQFTKVIELTSIIIKQIDDIDIRVIRAEAYYKTEQPFKAITDLLIVKAQGKKEARILYMLAENYLIIGKSNNAIKYANRLLEDYPQHTEIYRIRCTAYTQNKNFMLAKKDCDEILKIDPNNSYANSVSSMLKKLIAKSRSIKPAADHESSYLPEYLQVNNFKQRQAEKAKAEIIKRRKRKKKSRKKRKRQAEQDTNRIANSTGHQKTVRSIYAASPTLFTPNYSHLKAFAIENTQDIADLFVFLIEKILEKNSTVLPTVIYNNIALYSEIFSVYQMLIAGDETLKPHTINTAVVSLLVILNGIDTYHNEMTPDNSNRTMEVILKYAI